MSVYAKGNCMIAVEPPGTVFNTGKRPALYIGKGNELLKVGTFGSETKAEMFEDYLKNFFGKNLITDDRPYVPQATSQVPCG